MGRHEFDVRSIRIVCDGSGQTDGCGKYAATAICVCHQLLHGSGSTLSSAMAELEDRMYEHAEEAAILVAEVTGVAG